jgi:UDP-N-acetylglucosamine:LPS N-acetylglucosamine transferase
MQRVGLVYFDAGGGHRAAANALLQVIGRQQRPWDVRMINLQELLDPLDIFRKVTGLRLQDVYNLMLRKGWTLGSPQLVRAMHGVIRLYHGPTVRLLEKFWRDERPDLVVSVVPNFNRAIGQSLRQALPRVPLVTILTDFADYPPHFWIERQPQYFVCGTDRAVAQARAMGHDDAHIFRTSGMILAPKFYETVELDRRAERQKLGLDPDLPAGLVLFGGHGSRAMLDIARRLDTSGLKVQLILICGRSEALVRDLRAMPRHIPMFVEGFTGEVPYYMRLSDFFIGKPGPGSISEALAMKLPALVEKNAWTLPQERYNADWIVEKQTGIVLRNFRYIVQAVAELLQPENYRRFHAYAAAIENRAVFEIPDILDKILTTCGTPS